MTLAELKAITRAGPAVIMVAKADMLALLEQLEGDKNMPEGWVLLEPIANKALHNITRTLATRHVYPTQAEAERAIAYYHAPAGTVAVRVEWEE